MKILTHEMNTPLGPMVAGVFQDKLCFLEFSDRKNFEKQLEHLESSLNSRCEKNVHPLHSRVQSQLTEYFDGARKDFDLPLDVPGTEFQKKVWSALQDIPFGKARSYRQQAEAIGNVKAIRAVAQTNGKNRIALVIPCHRVIGSDGSLTGYAGGVERKRHLLELEGYL